MPMGETVIHKREAPWGHPGIDFLWDHEAPLVIVAAGEVVQIVVDAHGIGLDVAVITGEFIVTYDVAELYTVNPDIEVGSQVAAGQVLGYALPITPEDNWTSTHWAFGTWRKPSEPITTPEGLVLEYVTEYLCPLPYFTESEQQRLSRAWETATYEEKDQFPEICNGPYKNY